MRFPIAPFLASLLVGCGALLGIDDLAFDPGQGGASSVGGATGTGSTQVGGGGTSSSSSNGSGGVTSANGIVANIVGEDVVVTTDELEFRFNFEDGGALTWVKSADGNVVVVGQGTWPLVSPGALVYGSLFGLQNADEAFTNLTYTPLGTAAVVVAATGRMRGRLYDSAATIYPNGRIGWAFQFDTSTGSTAEELRWAQTYHDPSFGDWRNFDLLADGYSRLKQGGDADSDFVFSAQKSGGPGELGNGGQDSDFVHLNGIAALDPNVSAAGDFHMLFTAHPTPSLTDRSQETDKLLLAFTTLQPDIEASYNARTDALRIDMDGAAVTAEFSLGGTIRVFRPNLEIGGWPSVEYEVARRSLDDGAYEVIASSNNPVTQRAATYLLPNVLVIALMEDVGNAPEHGQTFRVRTP